MFEGSGAPALEPARGFLLELAQRVMSVTHHLLLLLLVGAAWALGLPGGWAPLGLWVSSLGGLGPLLQLACLFLASARG